MSSDTPLRLPRHTGGSSNDVKTRDDTHPENTPSSQDSAHEASLTDYHNDSILSTSSADGGRHPKGKRKRTTTRDKMILEDAYTSNPKPDKQARLDIVQRVSLNEKEVQIWFQNRRQNDRRKSRPLSAEEVASMRYAGSFNSSDPINTLSAGYPQRSQLSSDPAPAEQPSDPSPSNPASSSCPQGVQSTPLSACKVATSHAPDPSASAPTPLGYLANRWNLGTSFSTPSSVGQHVEESFRRASFTGSTSCSPDTSIYSTQSQSNLRLALSLEGKAELVSNALSPDRMAPVRPRTGLQRSQSAIVLPPVSTLIKATRRSSIRGRSRDVAAWVSAAHAEPRDELTEQAENESTGSAIAAISLLRSTSSSSILQPSGSSKRNASVTRDTQPDPAKKRRFNRTTSSVARLETSCDSRKVKDLGSLDQLKVSRLLSPTDSDKENLSPIDDEHPLRRRPLPSESSEVPDMSSSKPKPKPTNSRRTGVKVLQENAASLLNNRANILSLERRDSKLFKDGDIDIFQDPASAKKMKNQRRPAIGPQRENEVEKFMRGEQVSPSKKPDMDCVAGLLSLSQGAWR